MSSSEQRKPSTVHKAVLVGLVMVLGALVRLYGIGTENLWIDEVHQVRVASQSVSDIMRNYRPGAEYETIDQAPLSLIISHFFVTLRDLEFWARLPSAIFSSLGIMAFFVLCRSLLPFGTSWLAAVFLAVSPLDVWYAQEARWYALWSLLTIVAYGALIRADRSGSRVLWTVFGAATLAGLYTFIFSVFVFWSQGLSLVWRRVSGLGARRSLAIFCLVMMVVFVAAFPVVKTTIQRAGEAHSGTPRPSSVLEIPYTFLVFSAGFTVGPSVPELHLDASPIQMIREHPEMLVVIGVFAPIFLLGLWWILRDGELGSWLLPWLVITPAGIYLIALAIPAMTYQVRYGFASLPVFTLVLALGVASLRGWPRVAAAAAVIAVSCYSLANFYWCERYDKEDVRAAVNHIRAMETGGAQVVAVGQIEYALYLYGDPIRDTVIRGCGRSEGIDLDVDPTITVWLMTGRDWEHDLVRCNYLLLQDFEPVERAEFHGVDLVRMEPRNGGS